MKILKKIKNIYTGWGKRLGLLKSTEHETEIAALRMGECMNCNHGKASEFLVFINGESTREKVLKCELCGCPCWEKTIVMNESCPIGKW